MGISLKPLNEQIIVLTGATSGIGLSTALMAAQKGAKLVLAARNENNLKELVDQIERDGGTAAYCVTDVSKKDELEQLSKFAITKFGGYDTWINDAGVSIFGRVEQVSDEDNRKLFDTNFWSIVNGSNIAVAHLREKGGALINLGSIGSDIGIPLQGIYSASKHAIKGYTDALRIELNEAKAPISVTLIKPSAMATPLAQHARNYLDEEPKLPPPVYNPEEAAYAICHAAAHPVRDVYVGGAGRIMVAMQHFMPGVTDWFGKLLMKSSTQPKGLVSHNDNVDKPGSDLREKGDGVGMVMPVSVYTRAALHPVISGLVIAGIGTGIALMCRKSDSKRAVHYRVKAQQFLERAQKKAYPVWKQAKKQVKQQGKPYFEQVQDKADSYVGQARDAVKKFAARF